MYQKTIQKQKKINKKNRLVIKKNNNPKILYYVKIVTICSKIHQAFPFLCVHKVHWVQCSFCERFVQHHLFLSCSDSPHYTFCSGCFSAFFMPLERDGLSFQQAVFDSECYGLVSSLQIFTPCLWQTYVNPLLFFTFSVCDQNNRSSLKLPIRHMLCLKCDIVKQKVEKKRNQKSACNVYLFVSIFWDLGQF